MDFDKCSVCHMDEEYEDNLFLQCDKCHMIVHARCYGELEPLDGLLWFCNLCRPGPPKIPPTCYLCPVVGDAIKPTTDGRWAHLTCAIWIPGPVETIVQPLRRCLWGMHSAYHPLCAHAADLCIELEDDDRINPMSLEEDDGQCIQLLSFCKKYKPPSNDHPATDDSTLPVQHGSNYVPTSNLSGCARSEPYNVLGRRGQREPQVFGAASAKRLYVENRSYLVSGYRQNGLVRDLLNGSVQAINISGSEDSISQNGSSESICSMSEKYNIMKATFRKRLTFGY